MRAGDGSVPTRRVVAGRLRTARLAQVTYVRLRYA